VAFVADFEAPYSFLVNAFHQPRPDVTNEEEMKTGEAGGGYRRRDDDDRSKREAGCLTVGSTGHAAGMTCSGVKRVSIV
jgi:hypothetical protein